MGRADPKEYYASLGVDPAADSATIHLAYRQRAKQIHPDHDPSPEAREAFLRLQEAYAVLSDGLERAAYDRAAAEAAQAALPPLTVCGCCGRLTAQPRHISFRIVRSVLIWGRASRRSGIFCRDCADRAAIEAAITCWAWGWWSLPGLLLTPWALLSNLLGGHKGRRINFRLLCGQAEAFLARDNLALAHSLASQARRFARDRAERAEADTLLQRSAAGASPHRRLRSRWGLLGPALLPQALPLLALPLTLGIFALIALRPWEPPPSTVAQITLQPARVGEMRHVAVDGLKLREAPLPRSPVLTLLDRFAPVEITATPEDPDWVGVRTASGVEGFVETRLLYAGSGERFRSAWCRDHRGSPPGPGEVLSHPVGGDHRLLLHNDGRRDGVVKLKTLAGATVLSVYVPATFHIGVGGIPDGTYRIEYATGGDFSRGCGLFLDDMRASVLPMTVTFRYQSPTAPRSLNRIAEVWLTPQHDNDPPPLPLPPDRFALDE